MATQSAPHQEGVVGPVEVTLRPALALRVLGMLAGAVCAAGAVAQAVRALRAGPDAALGALVLLAPVLFAAAILRKRIDYDDDGLRSTTLAGQIRAPWAAVLRVEQTRGGFVVVTSAGPVSAGWLSPANREGLLRAVLQKARLVASGDPPPTGIRMVYVPRAARVQWLGTGRPPGDRSATPDKEGSDP